MGSFYEGTDPDVDVGGAEQSVELAAAWAIKMDGPVEGSSYSSQWNATQSASSASQSATFATNASNSADSAQSAADQLNSLLLGDLVDVDGTPPAEGDVLTWVAANGRWEPKAPV